MFLKSILINFYMYKILKNFFLFLKIEILFPFYQKYFYIFDISKISIDSLFFPKTVKSEIYRDSLFNIVKKKYNNKIKRVLDFGCGIGINIPFIFKNFRNIEYYVYDNNSLIIENLNRANNLIYKKKIHYLNKNEVFKINENFFDLIVLDACVMYFSKKEIFEYFNFFNTITSKCILIHDLNHFNEKVIIKKDQGKNIINYNKIFKKINPGLKLTFQKSKRTKYPWDQFGYIILIEKYKPQTD